MAEVNQRLELVHLPAQLIDLVRCLPLRLEKRISLRHVRREDFVLDGEIHFRRKIIDAVVAEAELGRELLDRHELDRRHSKAGEMWDLLRHIEKRARFSWQIRGEKTPTCN